MDRAAEFYTGAMYGILDAIHEGSFSHKDDMGYEAPLLHSDNVAKALIETGHQPFLQLILAKERDSTFFAEALDTYLKAGRFDMVVATLRAHPVRGVSHLDFSKFVQSLLDVGSGDQLILDFAEYLKWGDENQDRFSSSDNSYYSQELIYGLFEVGRDDLAQAVLDRFIQPGEVPFFLLVKRLMRGGEVMPQEVAETFDVYCPLAEQKGPRDWEQARRLVGIVQFFVRKLVDMDAPIPLLQTTFLAHVARKKTDQMGWLDSGIASDHEGKVWGWLIAEEKFGQAWEFVEVMDSYSGKRDVSRARLNYATAYGDEEEHRQALDILLRVKDEEVARLIEHASKIDDEESIPTQAEKYERVRYYALRSEQDAEQAIFELKHGSAEAAQVYIDRMIATVERIGVPPVEDCPIQHRKTLRKDKLHQKRVLREHFLRAGFLDKLPCKDGWSDAIHVTLAQKYAVRKKKWVVREEQQGQARQEKEANDGVWERKKNEERNAAIREALEVGPDEAIAVLKEQIGHRCTDTGDWARGAMILEAAPDRFKGLVKILSKGYFKRSYIVEWERYSHDGLAEFYMVGQRLGIVGDNDWDQLIRNWYRARFLPDNRRPMPHKGVVAMVGAFLREGAWDEAIKYFDKAQEGQDGEGDILQRRTYMECMAHFIRHAAANMEEGVSGAEAAFRAGDLPEQAPRQQQIEYWNSRVECALAQKDDGEYGLAYDELLSLLDDPASVRLWTSLMALGSLRTPHQKKDVCLGAHALHRECQQARWRIVSAMIDHEIPGAEAMADVKSKETPDRVTILFLRKLIQKGVLHKHTSEYLTSEYLPYLRRMLSQHQNQFNTAMETIQRDLEENSPRYGGKARLDVDQWPGVVTLLDSVRVITPGIYAEAKSLDFVPRDLAQLGEKIAKLKKGIFSNTPLGSDITPELMAELIWIAYQPANMDLSTVERLCRRVSDCSHHLDGYKFATDGYSLDLLTNRTMYLRDGARLRTPMVIYRRPQVPVPLSPELHKPVPAEQQMVRNLCNVGKLSMGDVSLDDVLVVLEGDEFMQSAFREWRTAKTDDDRYRALRKNQEALGVYMEDNLESAVLAFLEKHQSTTSRMVSALVKNLKKPGKRRAIQQQLGVEIDDSKSDREVAAQVIAQAALQKLKLLQEMRRAVRDDVRNFVTDQGEEVASADTQLRAVISKNKASFFAKASAGICTDRDIDLFEREDHFHINLIDDREERCVGNIQAYIMEHNGQPHLLLRGLNPSTKLLKEVDVDSLCEAIIGVGQRFARENGLAGVLLSEQGSFLALSNRPEVVSYVQRAYKDNVVDLDDGFKITSGRAIHKVYLVGGQPQEVALKDIRRASVHDYPSASMAA